MRAGLLLGGSDGRLLVRIDEAAPGLAGLELRSLSGAHAGAAVLLRAARRGAVGVGHAPARDELLSGAVADVLGTGGVGGGKDGDGNWGLC